MAKTTEGKHSLTIKAKLTGFEATAQGWGLLPFVLVVALAFFGLAMGWWQIPASGR